LGGIKKAVITAAGRGTRHFPATRTVQKELFPLVDQDGATKPVLQIVAEEALAAGAERICIVCSPVSEGPVRAHFEPVSADLRASLAAKPNILKEADRLDRLAGRLEFVIQPTPEGYGDAVLCAGEFVGGDPFLLLLGDHVYAPKGEERCSVFLANAFERLNGPVSGVARTPEGQLRLFGTVQGEPLGGDPPVYRVTDMAEKPAPEVARRRLRTAGLPEGEYLTFFGMHVLTPRVFDHLAERKARDLREGGEIQLTSSLEAMVREGEYYAAEIPGRRLDMGVPEGLIYAQTTLASLSPYRNFIDDALSGS
jgi:UTP--glucose-1-phosphate uridylyltransferase